MSYRPTNSDINTNVLKYIIPKLNTNIDNTVTDNFCVAATGSDVGIPSKFVYSNDGVNWSEADSGSKILDVCNCISYNGLIWVAGGLKLECGSGLAYSVDGKNWLSVNCSPFEGGQCCDVMWANGKWFACGSNSVTTTTPFNSNNISNNKILDAKGIFINSDGNGLIVSSHNGISWDLEYESCHVNVFTCLAYNGIYYMVGGNNHKIKWSIDGNCWHTVCGDKPYFTTALSYNNKMWIAAGFDDEYNNEMSYSYCDTQGWSTINPLEYFNGKIPNKLAWNGSVWVLVAYPYFGLETGSIQIAYSRNGHSWSAAQDTSTLIDVVFSLTWNGLSWVAAGGNLNEETETIEPAFIYSLNGENWYANERVLLSGNSLPGNYLITAIESRNILNYQRVHHTISLSEVAYWYQELFANAVPANSNARITNQSRLPTTDANDTNLADNKRSTIHIRPDLDVAPAKVAPKVAPAKVAK